MTVNPASSVYDIVQDLLLSASPRPYGTFIVDFKSFAPRLVGSTLEEGGLTQCMDRLIAGLDLLCPTLSRGDRIKTLHFVYDFGQPSNHARLSAEARLRTRLINAGHPPHALDNPVPARQGDTTPTTRNTDR